jgi:hypothetical protein
MFFKSKKTSVTSSKADNPFYQVRGLLADIAGKIPAPLIFILVFAAVMAIFIGSLMMVVQNQERSDQEFLAQRLSADENKPALQEQNLAGIWLHRSDTQISTLRLGNGLFEWIAKDPTFPNVRTFIRGSYKIQGNILILHQRYDLGVPYDLNRPEITFFPQPFANINLKVEMTDKIMLWQLVPSEIDQTPREIQDFWRAHQAQGLRWMKISNQVE